MEIEAFLAGLPDEAERALESELAHASGFCRRFLDRVEEVWFQDPQAALEPARLGLRLAAVAGGVAPGRDQADALKTRALSVLGGVYRSLGRFDEAEASYHLAAELLLAAGDELALADLARRLATLRRDQERFDEARRLARCAVDCYSRHGQERSLAQTLVQLGVIHGCERRDSEQTVLCFRAALEHLDPELDATYYRCAVHNLANALCLEGDASALPEIGHWLRRLRQLGGFEPGTPAALKVRWLEGLTAQREGRDRVAERTLLEARDGFLELELAGEAAAVSMDLAQLYLEAGRVRDARRLASRLFPIFQALRSHREVTAALSLYVNAAMLDRLSTDVVAEVKKVMEAKGWGPAY